MHQPRYILRTAFVLSIVLLTAALSFSQQKVEPSFDVSLQLVIGSNDTNQKSDLPANLSAITKQLKTNFAYSNYRVASTLLGRISDTGTLEYKSVSNILGPESTGGPPSFHEWIVNDLRSLPNAKGQPGLQARAFRFGARVPVITGNFKEESGKISPIINYEGIGLTLNKVGLSENIPTLLGTLSLPSTTGTIFLVITIRSADQ